jgi:hypothetical protein
VVGSGRSANTEEVERNGRAAADDGLASVRQAYCFRSVPTSNRAALPSGRIYRALYGKRQRRVAGTTWRAVLLLVRRADDFLERAGGGARSSANERFTGKENGMWRAGPWARRERRVIHVSQFGPWAERFRRYPKISVIPVCHWQWPFSFFKAHACDLLRFHGLSNFVVSCTECSWVALALGMYGSHGLQYQNRLVFVKIDCENKSVFMKTDKIGMD